MHVSVIGMQIRTIRRNINSFSGLVLYMLIIIGTIGNSFGVSNAFAEVQLHTPQPSTIMYNSPWSNNVPLDLNNRTQHNNAVISLSQLFTNSKNLDLNHAFVSNKVIGPDRFRFITSYWTTSTTSRVIDAGTSANESRFPQALVSNSWPDLNANPKLEVDTGEGFSTLAIVLQYQGVVHLAGITAALKLPAGFKAEFPLASDRYNYDIALSSYRGHIYPSQGIVLYFQIDVLPTAKVQVPVLGPLALHFLRSDERSILDLLDASQQDIFARVLSVTNTTFPNSTKLNDNFDFARDYFNQFGRFVPFDFINQVIPVIFKVTGQEVLDVHLPYTNEATRNCISYQCNTTKGIVPGNGDIVPVRVTFSNFGDAVITNLVGAISTATPTLVGSAVSAETYPLGIVSPTTFNLGILPPYSSQTVTLLVRSVQNCDTLQPLHVLSTYNDVIGLRQTQDNTVVLQITGRCQQQVLGVEPGSGIPEVIPQAQGALSLPPSNATASTLLARPAHIIPTPSAHIPVHVR